MALPYKNVSINGTIGRALIFIAFENLVFIIDTRSHSVYIVCTND